MTAQEILKLIEEASPDDTAKLDEIDNHVRRYIFGAGEPYEGRCLDYSRSRDALKQIRPEGWRLSVDGIAWVGVETKKNISQDKFACSLLNLKRDAFVNSYGLPTEELAELHAIIQAIEYERNNA